MNAVTAAARRLSWDDDSCVLARRPLRDGTARTATSRVSDDIWDLTPALLQRHKNALILNFPTLPAQFRLAVRELCYALLTGDLPPGEREPAPDTIRSYFSALKQFLTWLDERGVMLLRSLEPADLDAYNDHLLTSGLSLSHLAQRRHAARLLWVYAGKLTSDALTFDPGALPGWAAAPSSRAGENSTPRIPEQVIAPLLTWALTWINELAGDIFAAFEEWRLLHANTQLNRRRRNAPPISNTAGKLEQLLQRYRAERRSLPGGPDGKPVRAHLAREIGCTPGAFRTPRCQELLASAAAGLGVADHAYLRTEITGRLGGQPWISQIPYAEAEYLARLLQAAAWVTIAYLSGMRDSEVKHLRPGCLSVSRAEDGRIYRRKLTSLAFKGETDPPASPRPGSSANPSNAPSRSWNGCKPAGTPTCSRGPPGPRTTCAPTPPAPKAPSRPTTTSPPSPSGSAPSAGSTAGPAASRSSADSGGGYPPASSAGPWPGSSPASPVASSPDPWPTAITASRCSKATPRLGNCIRRARSRRSPGRRGVARDFRGFT